MTATPFTFDLTRDVLFNGIDHTYLPRFSVRVEHHGDIFDTFQVMFNGRGFRGSATERSVLTVVGKAHPMAKRLLPRAKSDYVVIYDTADRDDVAEAVASVEQLAAIAIAHAVRPDEQAVACSRFAAHGRIGNA